MRKLGIVVTALACLTIMAFAAQAATAPVGDDLKGQFSIGVDGGLAVPMGKLASAFDITLPANSEEQGADMKMGYDFGLFIDYFVTKELAIGADFGYVTNNMKDQTILGTTFTDLFKAKTMQYGIHGKYFLPTGGAMAPYLGVGVSMYSRKFDLSNEAQTGFGVTETSWSDSKPGIAGMVGVDYKVSPTLSIGVNGAYHYTIGKFEHDFGGTEGTQTILKDWNYMTFNAAVTCHIPMAKK